MLRRSLPKLALQHTLPMEHLILKAIGLGNNISFLLVVSTVANDQDQMKIVISNVLLLGSTILLIIFCGRMKKLRLRIVFEYHKTGFRICNSQKESM